MVVVDALLAGVFVKRLGRVVGLVAVFAEGQRILLGYRMGVWSGAG